MNLYFGKYRGKVANNMDPMQLGRIQVSVPRVLGQGRLSWAMPSMPYAGQQVGFFALPPIDANIWVEFEGGDPGSPIWSGCFWGTGEFPTMTPSPSGNVLLKTNTCTVTVSDAPGSGGIILEMQSGMKISMTSTGFELNNGQGAVISLGPGPKVTINNGAVEVLF